MKYTSPDGHVIISDSNSPITYSCPQEGMTPGTFESYETTSADNEYGIQQIKIIRVVTSESVTITITESTNAELKAYIDSINNIEQQLPINLN